MSSVRIGICNNVDFLRRISVKSQVCAHCRSFWSMAWRLDHLFSMIARCKCKDRSQLIVNSQFSSVKTVLQP